MEVRCRAHTSTYYLYMCMRVRHHFSEETILQKAAFRKICYMVFGLSTLAFVSSFISPLSGHLRLSLSLFSSLSFFLLHLSLSLFLFLFLPLSSSSSFFFLLPLLGRSRLRSWKTKYQRHADTKRTTVVERDDKTPRKNIAGKQVNRTAKRNRSRNRRIPIDPMYRRCYRRRWLVQIVRAFRNTDTIRRDTTRHDTTRH